MRKETKIYIVTVSGQRSDDTIWENKEFCRAETPEKAIEEVKIKDRKSIGRDREYVIDENFTYTAVERPNINKEEDKIGSLLENRLDYAIDEALDSVKYLADKMVQLAERLKFQRENASYNTFGEIQGSASSVEIAIGKVVALQDLQRQID
jgi:hypothetical protein